MTDEAFEIVPRIIRANEGSRITVAGRFELQRFSRLAGEGRLTLEWIEAAGTLNRGERAGWGEYHASGVELFAGDPDRIAFKLPPVGEGEVHCRLFLEREGSPRSLVCEFGVYALKPDLYARRPFRGDLHVHSSYSACGNPNDDPKFIAAKARLRGLDFMALTDHMQMGPSRQVQAFVGEFDTDFAIFPGEEVHLLEKRLESLFRRNQFLPAIHLVNFGGESGVGEYANANFERYLAAIQAQAAKLDPAFPESIRFLMAGADWIIERIHEVGGLAIFCHPFWRPEHRYNLPGPVREHILANSKFDAMEVIGLGATAADKPCAAYRESNQLCLAWWQDASIKKGRMIPLVGTTDSHATLDLLGHQYTLVFAEDLSYSSIAAAIRRGDSVAVSAWPGERPQLYGDFRLVQFGYFLLREFYGAHDVICQREGRLMLDRLRGESADREAMARFFKHNYA